ncbi:pyridoxamine 5'-phosphate oxidase family protein [[Clostridium] dakarense]|uniref:pyridoxamine 5'-phosphate oxidase family protein n=1 Tax=Faecalimicrobium dakarense TaxID=1301100 RepID=UPI0004AFE974|nr:pyridoxamine 5'-phosphate oxidase family protein [[Clostridium] dakarense]
MNKVVEFLKENQIQYFATVGLDGKPKVRPFQFMLEDDGNLYFCTSNKKDVYKEIENNPYVELTSSSSKFAWIRLSGKAIFSNNVDVKTKVIESSELVKSIYQSAKNPDFEVFHLEGAKAVISDFSGEPPKEYNL